MIIKARSATVAYHAAVATSQPTQPDHFTPSDTVLLEQETRDTLLSLAGAGLVMTGGGALLGSVFGSPQAGAVKGLATLSYSLAAGTLLERFESQIFNWSKVMPGYSDSPAKPPASPQNKILQATNTATNVLVLSALAAGQIGILFL